MELEGKHALVCGASLGIGRACAIELAKAGAQITAIARSTEKLETLMRELPSTGSSSNTFLAADMDHPEEFRQKIRSHLKTAGPVQILINNTAGPPHGPLLEADEQDFLSTFQRHVLTSHFLVKECLPSMQASQYGRIINIISTSVREPIVGLGVSNTIRGAMAGWSKTLSKELPPHITINNILPGFTATDRLAELRDAIARNHGKNREEIEKEWIAQIPERRLGEPQDIGRVVAFLASPASSYIRGVSLPVDGGKMHAL